MYSIQFLHKSYPILLLTLLGLFTFVRIRKKRNEEDVFIDDYVGIGDVSVEADNIESMDKVVVVSAEQNEEEDENDRNDDSEKNVGTLNADYGVKTYIK